jgi:hypothetical protein
MRAGCFETPAGGAEQIVTYTIARSGHVAASGD